MSGAIIAIESGFNGSIENISDNLAANIRVNGTSTFFLFIIGHKDILIKYCETFFSTADFLSLETDKIIFLLENESGSKELPWTPTIKKANRDKKIKEIAHNNNINLKEGIPKLFTENGNRVNDLNVAAFRLIGNAQSQYIGGLNVKNIDLSSFIYEPSFSIEYCNGEKIKEGDLSTFELINDKEKANFTITATNGSTVYDMDTRRYPLAVAINTKNDPLKKGCYRINYEIIQRAIIPQWVTKRNAATLNELEESNKPDAVIKVLRLESIYRYIAEAYNNRPEWGRVYADSLYLEKQR
jgi:type VI protein secretion system component Hcp